MLLELYSGFAIDPDRIVYIQKSNMLTPVGIHEGTIVYYIVEGELESRSVPASYGHILDIITKYYSEKE